MRPVERVEPGEHSGFLPEELDGGDAGNVLIEERVQPRQEPSDLTIRLAHVLAEPHRRQRNERQDGEGDQRESPVHEEHRRHDADEHEHVAEDGDESRGEQIVERVDVGRDPRHQPADRIAIVEAEVEPLEVAVHLHPQRVHDALPDGLKDVRLAVLASEPGDEQAGKEQDQADEGRRGRRSRCSGRWPAASARAGRARQSTRPARPRPPARPPRRVRPQIHDQPPHQARVVGLPEHVLLHVAAHVASSSSSSNCRSCISAYTPPCPTSVGVVAALDDAPVGQDENLVGVTDRRHAMRDHQAGPRSPHLAQTRENALFGRRCPPPRARRPARGCQARRRARARSPRAVSARPTA